MNEEEKEVIKKFKNFIYVYQDVIEDDFSDYEEKESAKEYLEVSEKILNLISKLQKELYKKDKVIDLMADHIYEHDISTTGLYEWRDNEQIKECFYKEVEEGND